MNKNLPIAIVEVPQDVVIEYNKYSYLQARYANAINQIKKRGIPEEYKELYEKLVKEAAANRFVLEAYIIYLRDVYIPKQHKFKYFTPSLANSALLIYPYPDREGFYKQCLNQN